MEIDHVYSQLYNYLPEIWDTLPTYDCGERNEEQLVNKEENTNGTLEEVNQGPK